MGGTSRKATLPFSTIKVAVRGRGKPKTQDFRGFRLHNLLMTGAWAVNNVRRRAPCFERRKGLDEGSAVRLLRCKCSFEDGDAARQGLVLFARTGGHRLDRLELLARHDVHVAQHALALSTNEGRNLALHALRGAGGVRHQLGDLVKETVVGLGHGVPEGSAVGDGAVEVICGSKARCASDPCDYATS